jgi:protein phosphatase
MALYLRYAARSDVGLVRKGNEDSGYAGARLLAVADGMGGHAAGELASAMAVASFAEVAGEELDGTNALAVLGDVIDQASERIEEVIGQRPEFKGMGTTFTGLAWLADRLALVHVGDSRAYLYREGRLIQLTRDHTYVQTLVDSGQITAEEAISHPRRNLIMRAIDGVNPVEPDLSIRDLQPGDRYLLCTDGLSGVVPDAVIEDELSRGEPTGVVTRLVDLALENGAPDNVTVVVADVVDVPDRVGGEAAMPVVVGSASERRNREQLPNVPWPVDEQFDPDRTTPGTYPRGEDGLLVDDDYVEWELPEPSPWYKNWIVLTAAAVALVLALVTAISLWWISNQWYVGVYDGRVAVYQGVPGSIGPMPLQRLNQETAIEVADLPVLDQQRVEQSIGVSSQQQAVGTVAELDARAQACRSDEPPPGCPAAQLLPSDPGGSA